MLALHKECYNGHHVAERITCITRLVSGRCKYKQDIQSKSWISFIGTYFFPQLDANNKRQRVGLLSGDGISRPAPVNHPSGGLRAKQSHFKIYDNYNLLLFQKRFGKKIRPKRWATPQLWSSAGRSRSGGSRSGGSLVGSCLTHKLCGKSSSDRLFCMSKQKSS